MPLALVIRPLTLDDERSQFTCGDEDLDLYFRNHAGQALRKGTAGVLVAVLDDDVVGFATSISTEIDTADLPEPLVKRLPDRVPVLRLARLGVAEDLHAQGIGGQLLQRVCEQALDLRGRHGCVGVLVDAKPQAVGYYERFKFELLPEPDNGSPTTPMFLPIGFIEAAHSGTGE